MYSIINKSIRIRRKSKRTNMASCAGCQVYAGVGMMLIMRISG